MRNLVTVGTTFFSHHWQGTYNIHCRWNLRTQIIPLGINRITGQIDRFGIEKSQTYCTLLG